MAEKLQTFKTKVNELLAKYPVIDNKLTSVSAKAGGVDKAYLAVAALLLPVLFIMFLGKGEFLIDIVGIAYPAYASIKAVESTDKSDDTQWLVYWCIFAHFKLVEGIADTLLALIPFYLLIKVGFLVWCYHPSTLGATVVYNAVVKPYIVPLIQCETSAAGAGAGAKKAQ